MKSLIILLLLVSNLYPQGYNDLDSIPKFRGFDWGETLENIKSKELADYKQTFIGFGVNTLSYSGKIAELDADIDYVFENDVLSEGIYIIKVELSFFDEAFEKIKNYYFQKLNIPHYWASSHPNSKINWNDTVENETCRGPEIYWEYCNGFIGIVAEKFKEEITITVIYVHQKTIQSYGKYVTFPY